jgi:hypothetical protein
MAWLGDVMKIRGKSEMRGDETEREASPWADRRIHLLRILILLGVGFGVYANVLSHNWAYDDKHLIRDNKLVKGGIDISALIDPSTYYKAAVEDNYIPLTTLSLMVDYAAWNGKPAGFHRTNVAVHLLDSVLVYFLVLMLLGSGWTAFLAALLFTVHPIHTESVAWIAGRTDLFSGLFFLLAILLYLRAVPRTGSLRIAPYAASIIAFAISLFFKEMTITLLPILVLIDVVNSRDRPTAVVVRRSRYYAAYFAVTVLYLAGRLFVYNKGILDLEVYPGGRVETAVLTMTRGIVFYVKLLTLPIRLCVYHIFPLTTSFLEPAVLLSGGFVVALIILAVRFRRRTRALALGIGWFFVTLLPVCNLIPVPGGIVAERYLYIPSLGFCIIAADGILRLRSRVGRAVVAIVTIALLGFYGGATVYRNQDWKDDLALWTSAIKVYPENGKAYLNRGMARGQRKEFDLAIADYDAAIALDPRFALAYNNRGVAHASLGRLTEALADFNRAIRLNPRLPTAFLGRAFVQRNLGRHDLAAQDEAWARSLLGGEGAGSLRRPQP